MSMRTRSGLRSRAILMPSSAEPAAPACGVPGRRSCRARHRAAARQMAAKVDEEAESAPGPDSVIAVLTLELDEAADRQPVQRVERLAGAPPDVRDRPLEDVTLAREEDRVIGTAPDKAAVVSFGPRSPILRIGVE